MHRFTSHQRKQTGFTLLEVLLVVAIISILAGIVIIAINPSKNLSDTRNSQRAADVNTILSATYQYYLDTNAMPPAGTGTGITTSPTEICATNAVSCAGQVDLSAVTSNEKYVVSIPTDPQCATVCAVHGTGYSISKDASGRLTVSAPYAENGKVITVSR
jgi:prepilin-type N-terminal cleavage/methylation domain-containing protein